MLELRSITVSDVGLYINDVGVKEYAFKLNVTEGYQNSSIVQQVRIGLQMTPCQQPTEKNELVALQMYSQVFDARKNLLNSQIIPIQTSPAVC
ncbi:hypothetical protein FGO68_gene9503 [Halteria grandinella]|uniref:Uncharacterized protein n=1 Tax=Halteria grandinella TaxID=5974 RepID=A0A8J8P2Q9_HALGN|nr:hypothetical protein FGO68_gene9503 [Halteria grandinella]